MRHHGKDDQGPKGRRPRLPNFPNAPEKDPFQSLFAYAYLQAEGQRKRAEEEINKDADSLSAVLEVQHTLAVSDLDLQAKLEFIAEQARKLSNASGVVIALAEGESIVCRARSGLVGPPLGARLNPRLGISGECIRTGEILHCDDTETDPRVDLSACRNLGIRSILAVPLKRQDESLGLLEIFSGWAGVFVERDIRTARLLCGCIIEVLWAEQRAGAGEAYPALSYPPVETAEPAEIDAAAPQAGGAALAEPAEDMAIGAPAAETIAQVADPRTAAFRFESLEPERAPVASSLKIAALAVLIVVLGVLLWRTLLAPHSNPSKPIVRMPEAMQSPDSNPEAAATAAAPAAPPGTPALPLGTAELTAVRLWSKPDYTSIALFLDAPVKFTAGALHKPERIYFDLDQTTLGPNFPTKTKEFVISVDDHMVRTIRLARNAAGGTRVVLDMKVAGEYNSVISLNPPYRLMIAVHRPGAKDVTFGDPDALLQAPAAPTATGAEPAQPRPQETATLGAHRKLRIVIDPGHGGSEDGAIGPTGLKEKDLVLDVARRLGDRLGNRLDVDVYYTRTGDRGVALADRTALANSLGADLFISVHANSSGDPTARGVETYYMDNASSQHEKEVAARENAVSARLVRALAPARREALSDKISRSRKLANLVQDALYHKLADVEPSLRNRGVKRAPFVVLLGADMPSVLAEISFLSSPEDERELHNPEARDAVADALYRGIARYLTGIQPEKRAPHTVATAGN